MPPEKEKPYLIVWSEKYDAAPNIEYFESIEELTDRYTKLKDMEDVTVDLSVEVRRYLKFEPVEVATKWVLK